MFLLCLIAGVPSIFFTSLGQIKLKFSYDWSNNYIDGKLEYLFRDNGVQSRAVALTSE